VAKKTRTPAPPKRVQAPQRRVDQKRPRSPEDRRTLYLAIAFAASGVALVAVVVAVIALTNGGGGGGGGAIGKKIDMSKLVGLQTGPAPWNTGLDHLPDRLKPLGLTPLPQEALHQHIHQHLDIFVNGKPITIPSGIGVFDGQFITELHTHSAGAEGLPGPETRPTGVIHVESPTDTTYVLGQFFGVWGVRLTSTCIGGYCKPAKPWRVYVNGKPYTGDPNDITLTRHKEIAFVIGTPPKKIPSSFAWVQGL
jgi:hypothetical protein